MYWYRPFLKNAVASSDPYGQPYVANQDTSRSSYTPSQVLQDNIYTITILTSPGIYFCLLASTTSSVSFLSQSDLWYQVHWWSKVAELTSHRAFQLEPTYSQQSWTLEPRQSLYTEITGYVALCILLSSPLLSSPLLSSPLLSSPSPLLSSSLPFPFRYAEYLLIHAGRLLF